MDDLRRDEGMTPDPSAFDDAEDRGDELNVSPASPSDLEDELPDYQPGEGPGPTPGE